MGRYVLQSYETVQLQSHTYQCIPVPLLLPLHKSYQLQETTKQYY